MTPEQRADITNGIWLCQTCAKLINNDELRFTAAVLLTWKVQAEQSAFHAIGKTAPRQDAVPVIDKWVNLSYPESAGITQELTAEGYVVRWSQANKQSELVELEGWEPSY